MLAALASTLVLAQTPQFEAPAGEKFAKVVYGGETVLPNGRIITPLGKRMYTAENLWRVELSPDEKTLVGITEAGLSLFDLTQASPKQKMIPIPKGSIAGKFSSDGASFACTPGSSVAKILPKSVFTFAHVMRSASFFFSSSSAITCCGEGARVCGG